MKGDLHAGDARHALDLFDGCGRRMAVTSTARTDVRSEQDRTVALSAIVIGKIPLACFIKLDQRLYPSWSVEVRPLVGKAQMGFDDRAADRLQIEHAAIAEKIFLDPAAGSLLDIGIGLSMDDPIIKPALTRRLSGDVPPPARRALHHLA